MPTITFRTLPILRVTYKSTYYTCGYFHDKQNTADTVALLLFLGVKVKVKQSRYRPGGHRGFQEVRVPRFHDNGTGWW
jgi:hypothetical protein